MENGKIYKDHKRYYELNSLDGKKCILLATIDSLQFNIDNGKTKPSLDYFNDMAKNIIKSDMPNNICFKKKIINDKTIIFIDEI